MIAAGHRSDDVWSYTPRQLQAFGFLAERRRNRERASALNIAILGARGDKKAIKAALKEFEK